MRRLGLLLVAVGIFIPLVLIPLTEGYRRNAGLLGNIQSMNLSVMPAKYEPRFEEIEVSKYAGLLGRFVDINSSGEIVPSNVSDKRTDPGFDPFRDRGAIPIDDYAALLPAGSTNTRLFTNRYSDEEVARALKVAKTQIEHKPGKYLMYQGWAVSREAVHLPFSWIVAASFVIIFVGVVLFIFAPRPT
jgi:hypothetical protein